MAQVAKVKHDGVVTHYVEAGPRGAARRGTVLLVHDGWFGADAETLWEQVIPLLADDFRVVAPDMLGFGQTDKMVLFDRSMYTYRATHLGSFIRATCEGADVHAVGTSMGGSILLRDAVTETPQIPARSVVSLSGSGGPWRSSFGSAELGSYEGDRDDIARVLAHMADEFAGRDDVVERRQANTERPGHVQCLLASGLRHPAGMPRPATDDWPAPLRELTVPVTVVAGRDDPLLEPEWQSHLDGVSPLLRTRVIDTRHAPSLDHPELVADIVRDTIDRADESVPARGGVS